MSADSDRPSLLAYFGVESAGESPVEQKLTDLKRRKTKRRLYTFLGVVGFAVVLGASLRLIGFSVTELVTQLPQFLQFLTEYFPPTTYTLPYVNVGVPFVDVGQYWAFMVEANLVLLVRSGGSLLGLGFLPPLFYDGITIVPGAMFVTLAVAIAGTTLGLPLALFFGVMSSERVVPYPFNFVLRATMSLVRAIPGLVWFLILIPLAGVGPFTAALAIMVDTVGYLGRLLTDELEEISDGPIEGIRSTGAGRSQVVSFGMLSQVFREFIAWVAFDFEHNVRSAIGLGIIGGGGLGLELYVQRQTFHYTKMMACIILIFLLAGSVELVSQRVRSYLREDDDADGTGVVEAFVTAPKKIISSTLGRR
ncbi:MAG: phosphonate ABC transporter, permease protein PhnE [Haloferacaceae archaeon]